MFERNRVDNSQQQTGVPVEIVRDDGTSAKGKLVVAISSKVIDVLNGSSQFLEFESFEGRRTIIAKSSLRDVRVIQATQQVAVPARHKDTEFDPYKILEVDPGATWDQIKSAYHARAKTYHPDRYSTAELPGEVKEYLAGMARRVNAAYAALEPAIKPRVTRAEPVYSSPAR